MKIKNMEADNIFKVPIGVRHASPDEAVAELGFAQASRINFVPQMLLAVLCDACLRICDIARDKRLRDIKPQTDNIRKAVKAWGETLAASMTDIEAYAYNYIVQEFAEFTEHRRWICEQKLEVDASAQVCRDPEVASLVEWVLMLYKEIYAWDKEMDEKYPRYIAYPARAAYRVLLRFVVGHVGDIKKAGYDMMPTLEARPAPGVIRNKAYEMAAHLDKTTTLPKK